MRRLRKNPNLFEGFILGGFKGYKNYTLNELEDETNQTFYNHERKEKNAD